MNSNLHSVPEQQPSFSIGVQDGVTVMSIHSDIHGFMMEALDVRRSVLSFSGGKGPYASSQTVQIKHNKVFEYFKRLVLHGLSEFPGASGLLNPKP